MKFLDRDIYQIVLRLEESAGQSQLTVSSVYDNIKRSNSSLARQKKRPLEDSIERALDRRRVEQRADAQNSDSDAALEAAEEQESKGKWLERDSFLLNRQMAKSWNFGKSPKPAAEAMDVDVDGAGAGAKVGRQANGEPRSKKRKLREVDRSPPQHTRLRDIGGLGNVKLQLIDAVLTPLREGDTLAHLGVQNSSTCVLLHGPSGCGKTKLAHAVAGSVGVAFIPVSAQSLVGGTSGESEKNIRDLFDEAIQLAPSLMFIDGIDSIAGRRDEAQKGMERRMVAEIMAGMDKTQASRGKNVVVLAATNRPEALDPAVRCRFEIELEVGMPNQDAREKILRAMTRGMALASDMDFTALAKMTPGYVGNDLKNVVKEAVRGAIRGLQKARVAKMVAETPEDDSTEDQLWEMLCQDRGTDDRCPEDFSITLDDFARSINRIKPASLREGFSTIPDTSWSDVGAMAHVRKQLQTSIIGPIKEPERYAAVGIKPAAGILLWGPPGCGKTLVAKAVANESKANFISIKGPELLNKYVGESERAVRQLFARARGSVPCVLFFDEMDALAPRRDDSLSDASARVVNTLLTELDGVGDRSGIYVIGATNRPDMIDEAIRRPGRLGTSIYVGLPTPEDRCEILRTLYRNAMVDREADDSVDLRAVALDERCAGFTGADLGNLMQAAAQACLARCTTPSADVPRVLQEDWERALHEVKPSVKNIEKYDHLE